MKPIHGCRFRIHCDTLGTQEEVESGRIVYNVIDIGHIGNITETYAASVTKSTIMSLPSKEAICIDSGVEKSFSFDFTRVCPGTPNEESLDATDWSNGHWIMWMLSKVVDRWQGATDGQYISLEMESDMDELYPSFAKTRCYIKQFTYSYLAGQPQVITGSIKFVMGSFKLSRNTENSIIYESNFSAYRSGLTDMSICMVTISSTTTAIDYPAVWQRYALIPDEDISKIWWCIDLTTPHDEAIRDGKGWDQGDNINLGEDTLTVYARYSR